MLVLGVGGEGGLARDGGWRRADADVGEGGLHLVEKHVELVLDLGEDVGHGDVCERVDDRRPTMWGEGCRSIVACSRVEEERRRWWW